MELGALIVETCGEITDDMGWRVISNVGARAFDVARQNSGHFEDVYCKP